MNIHVSNRRVLYTLLFLGLVLLPALGIIPVALAPKDQPPGKGPTLASEIGWVAFFLVGAAAVTVFAVRRCPASFSFTDVFTVHYLFHERVIKREDVVATTSEERSGTVGGGDTVPLTVEDSVVRMQLADGSKLSWGVPNKTRRRLEVLLGMWLAREGAEELAH